VREVWRELGTGQESEVSEYVVAFTSTVGYLVLRRDCQL
jgi:hypothetical protein